MSDAATPPADPVVPELMTSGEVAALFRRTTRTIRNWVRDGHLRPVCIGRTRLFRRSDVDQLIDGQAGTAADFSSDGDDVQCF